MEETNWLVDKLMIKHGFGSKDSVNLKNKVHKIVEFIRLIVSATKVWCFAA